MFFNVIYKKFLLGILMLFDVLCIGTAGYWYIGGFKNSLVDCVYMTFITISTIGYGEIIDMTGNPGARIFTMFVATSGIGVFTYLLSTLTAFVVEGEMKDAFRRKKMEKKAGKLDKHYIICGLHGEGVHIASELRTTGRPYIIVDVDRKNLEKFIENHENEIFIEGDATEDEVLQKAGIVRARGLFAVTGDDNQNLVICLSARQLNPSMKIIARAREVSHIEKMSKAGADKVISPHFIGGMRMASEMIRPSVVSFLDIMLRDRGKNLRIEEIAAPESFSERPVKDLHLEKYPYLMLLAIKSGEEWIYKPPLELVVRPGDALVFMATPQEKKDLKRVFE
jgi:voltage-gated potassium channel